MTRVEEIYQELRNEIISGELKGDTPLRENDLANRFNVSRTPIREVLHRLSSDKLIRIVPNSGAFVGAFTWEEAREIFSIRQVLESFASGLSALNISQGEIEQMESLYNQMLECQEKRDFVSYANLDEEFHEIINGSCGNQHLIDLIQSLNDQARLSGLRQNMYSQGKLERSLGFHRKIIDAFKQRDSHQVAYQIMAHGQDIFGGVTRDQILNIFYQQEL